MISISNNYFKIYTLILILLFFCFIFLLNSIGYVMGGDSYTYVEWANKIKNNDFSFINNNDEHSQKGYNYILSVYLITLLQFINIENWQILFTYINLAFLFMIFFLILNLLKKEISNLPVFFFALFIFFGNYEQFLWVRYILTDFIFYLLVSLNLYIIFIFKIYQKAKYLFLFLFIVLISFFTRPTFVVFGLIISSFIILYYCEKNNITKKYFLIILSIFFILFIVFFESIIVYDLFDEILADLSFKKIHGYYQEGLIVQHRFHTYIQVDKINFQNLIKLFLLKFFYFFVFWDSLYSIKHNILNMIIFLPLYFFNIYCIFNFKILTKYQQNLIIVCLIFIFCFVFFHSLTHIDYDWRFRLPLYFPMYLISLIGFSIYYKKFKGKFL